MSDPIFPVIETDASELYSIGMDRIVELEPGFDPDVIGSPESWLLEAVAEIASEVQTAASTVPEAIFRHFGETMLGLQLVEGVPSTASITVTCGDSLGHTIYEGTSFLLYLDGEIAYEFECAGDIVIAFGDTAATFTVTCTTATSDANGSGVAGVELVDSLPFVSSVELDTAAVDGTDAETDAAYVERLADTLQLLSTRPITSHDFETSARANFGGRWLCLDTYDADLATWDNPLTLTLVGIKDDGTAFTTPELEAVDTYMQAHRMANWVIHVEQPDFAAVDASFTITVAPGYDEAGTLADAITSAETFLSPASWGLPPGGDEVRWDGTTTVRYFGLVNAILNTVGVLSLDTLTLEGATTDYTLANEWTLVTNGTITGAVT